MLHNWHLPPPRNIIIVHAFPVRHRIAFSPTSAVDHAFRWPMTWYAPHSQCQSPKNVRNEVTSSAVYTSPFAYPSHTQFFHDLCRYICILQKKMVIAMQTSRNRFLNLRTSKSPNNGGNLLFPPLPLPASLWLSERWLFCSSEWAPSTVPATIHSLIHIKYQ